MQEYVIGFCLDGSKGEMVVVHKNRPSWQNGKINLPGGKVEDGETPEQAIVREFKEETGLDVGDAEVFGEMLDRDFKIYCMNVCLVGDKQIKPRPEETEKTEWVVAEEILHDPRLIPNLRVIVPLMVLKVRNWAIYDSLRYDSQSYHTISVTVPTLI